MALYHKQLHPYDALVSWPTQNQNSSLGILQSDRNIRKQATYDHQKKTEQVCVGGAEMYMPLCRKHYLMGSI